MAELTLIRHGQSLWNLQNLFTGWVDVPLSEQGIAEALAAGETLKNKKYDIVYVSTLIRAVQTAMMILAKNTAGKTPILQKTADATPEEKKIQAWSKIYSDATVSNSLPVYQAWQLNERYYGALQGLNKDETVQKYGAEQVKIWRRSYDVPPPQGESLKDTAARTIPWFESVIVPQLKAGKNILVAAHGNSLRSIIMFIDKLSESQVLELELKTGHPVQYNYQEGFIKA